VGRRFDRGQDVQTPFGKGVVREVRNRGRVLVDVKGRALLIEEADLSPLSGRKPPTRPGPAPAEASPGQTIPARTVSSEIDLHGLTVVDALMRVEETLNHALLANLHELRVIHGRSGGRIRAALHRRLKEFRAVRSFRLDPANPGVTIVSL
jgi:dsDNA-specific endonuclease/ATPase MutS2